MAFGDSGFASNEQSRGVGRRGRGGLGGGGAGGRGNGGKSRNRRSQRGNGGLNRTDPPLGDDPFTQDDLSSGSPFDDDVGGLGGTAGGPGSIFTGEGSDAAGDTDNYVGAAWGLLNQAGIQQAPMAGSLQSDWLDGQIEDWYSQYQGLGNLAGADAIPWDQYLYGKVGVAPPTGGVTLDWMQNTWGPAMRQLLSARYQAQSPRNRGVDMREWLAPQRTVQF